MLSITAYRARLEEARQRAQVSRLNLAGLMVAHNLSGREPSLLLQLPGPVEHGVNAHQADLREVPRLIAVGYGAETFGEAAYRTHRPLSDLGVRAGHGLAHATRTPIQRLSARVTRRSPWNRSLSSSRLVCSAPG